MSKTTIDLMNTKVAFANRSNSDLRKEIILFKIMSNNYLVDIGSSVTQWLFKWKVPITPLVKHSIYQQFCGGENLQKTKKVIDKLAPYNLKIILDYGVEAKKREADFNRTTEKILEAIEYAQSKEAVPAVSVKVTGLARFDLLKKVHQGITLSKSEQKAWANVKDRLNRLCQTAHDAKTAVYIDAEESWIQDAIDRLVGEMMEMYNKNHPAVYNTIQLYRHDRLEFLKQSHQTAKANGYLLAVKLVRGAYMEKERARAERKGYLSPIQPNKKATDTDFDKALTYCVSNINEIAFCNASHNEESSIYLTQLMQENNISPKHPHVWFAQLYGMGDHISFNLANYDFNVAKYLPYGPVKEVIPYLIRRANENTSVAGQLTRELILLKKELARRTD